MPERTIRDKTISVRLDREAQRALDRLTTQGRSASEAVRHALLTAARHERAEQFAADVARVGGDEADRALIAEIRSSMDDLVPEG